MKISVVIPCYNEERIIERTIKNLNLFFHRHESDFEKYQLILVDDGSTDRTEFIIWQVAKNNNHIKAIRIHENSGKGFAIRVGRNFAKYETILILDADLSVHPGEIFKAMYLIKDKPIIITGERRQLVPQPLYRRFLGWGFSVLHRSLFGLGVIDSQAPFKILHYVPESFIDQLKIDGFAYDVELLYKAKQAGIPIKSVQVDYVNDRHSSVTIKKAIKMFFDLFRIRFE